MRLQTENLTFDSASRQLWVDGREVHLSNKAFDLLALIIERRPEAVSKTELHARLWPGTFVSASSLPSLISEIRVAIDDRRRHPHLIRTVHAFGYAFAYPGSDAPDGQSDEATPTGWLIGDPDEIALLPGANVLGREGPGLILLKSSTVSRRHARFSIGADRAEVEDLGSKNGTYVNNRRVEGPVPVVDGDLVRIGSLLFTFRRSKPAHSTQSLSSLTGGRQRS